MGRHRRIRRPSEEPSASTRRLVLCSQQTVASGLGSGTFCCCLSLNLKSVSASIYTTTQNRISMTSGEKCPKLFNCVTRPGTSSWRSVTVSKIVNFMDKCCVLNRLHGGTSPQTLDKKPRHFPPHGSPKRMRGSVTRVCEWRQMVAKPVRLLAASHASSKGKKARAP